MLSAVFSFGFAMACFPHNKPAKLMKNEKKNEREKRSAEKNEHLF